MTILKLLTIFLLLQMLPVKLSMAALHEMRIGKKKTKGTGMM